MARLFGETHASPLLFHLFFPELFILVQLLQPPPTSVRCLNNFTFPLFDPLLSRKRRVIYSRIIGTLQKESIT